jgi:hypothetical protein
MSEKRKHAILLALIAIVPPTVSGLLSHCQSAVEARAKAKSAKQSAETHADETSEALLDEVNLAIEELQAAVTASQEWAEATTTEVKKLNAKAEELDKATTFCKAYIQFDSRGRYRPPTETSAGAGKPSAPEMRHPKPSIKLPDNIEQLKRAK